MKIYLVGGAVRDELLGLPLKEKDWVVVGATVDDMLRLGYRQVGKDFPVFLHPETNEEYALARTERKVGLGYKGFTFDSSAQVTLEDDLKRRDLTINAIAKDLENGQLIDPYHGQADLKKKILRHVSPAFSEDPVRILRAARFAARFADFQIAAETNELMRKMILSGEVDALVPERVFKEWERALTEKHPEKFFEVLEQCGALSILFPHLTANNPLLNKIAKLSCDPQVRFAASLNSLPVAEIKKLCDRYKVPTDYRELALLAANFLEPAAHLTTSKDILQLLLQLDAFRREERFKKFLVILSATSDSTLQKYYDAAKKVSGKEFQHTELSGKEIADKINQKRIAEIEKILLRNS